MSGLLISLIDSVTGLEVAQKSINGAGLVNVANSLISYVWAGAGTTNAPNPSTFANFVVGVNSGGAATGNVYHVINGAWVDTGATVKNLYGGA